MCMKMLSKIMVNFAALSTISETFIPGDKSTCNNTLYISHGFTPIKQSSSTPLAIGPCAIHDWSLMMSPGVTLKTPACAGQ